jgi:hypothetical protein
MTALMRPTHISFGRVWAWAGSNPESLVDGLQLFDFRWALLPDVDNRSQNLIRNTQ